MGFLRKLLGSESEEPASTPTRPDIGPSPAAAVHISEGGEDLQVVGESFYQDALLEMAGAAVGERVRVDVIAVLTADKDNPYDANALSVWVNESKVGHLSRDDAQRMRPGLIALQEQHGMPIALRGVISGGGQRADGPGMFGVFLRYDPQDFGLQSSGTRSTRERRMDTGLSDALATDEADESYDLGWMADLPSDSIGAIKALRKLLETEKDPLDRHFMFLQLESELYKSRDSFSSALDEFDDCCRVHDAEMEAICAAFVGKWGTVPRLNTYKQMCIRLAKAKDYEAALWWAERGLALYGERAAREDAVADLQKRAAGYRTRLEG